MNEAARLQIAISGSWPSHPRSRRRRRRRWRSTSFSYRYFLAVIIREPSMPGMEVAVYRAVANSSNAAEQYGHCRRRRRRATSFLQTDAGSSEEKYREIQSCTLHEILNSALSSDGERQTNERTNGQTDGRTARMQL